MPSILVCHRRIWDLYGVRLKADASCGLRHLMERLLGRDPYESHQALIGPMPPAATAKPSPDPDGVPFEKQIWWINGLAHQVKPMGCDRGRGRRHHGLNRPRLRAVFYSSPLTFWHGILDSLQEAMYSIVATENGKIAMRCSPHFAERFFSTEDFQKRMTSLGQLCFFLWGR